MGALKIGVTFVFVVLLLRCKLGVGYVLTLAAALLGGLFGLGVTDIGGAMYQAITSPKTLGLAGLVLLITILGRVLKHTENLKTLIESLTGLFRDRRTVMAGCTAAIGLMPMPGGAMLSAPLVEEASQGAGLDAERKTLVNYWFRHVWEYWFPLYPGVILSAGLLGVPIFKVSLVNLPLTPAAILGGVLFCFWGTPRTSDLAAAADGRVRCAGRLVQCLWPILFVLCAALALKYGLPHLGIPLEQKGSFELLLLVPLALVLCVMAAYYRLSRSDMTAILKDGLRLDVVCMVLGVMIFKEMADETGAGRSVYESLTAAAVPPVVVLGVLPFVMGLLTGFTAAFIGICIPLLEACLRQDGQVVYSYLMFAYACGFLGVLLSPVHLCLLLSRDYFRANLGAVYRLLWRPAAVVLVAALAEMILLRSLLPSG